MRVGVDVGGTFTDLYGYDRDGRRRIIAKVPSTPPDFTLGVLRAIEDANIDIESIDFLIHGSTIATNATVERTYPLTPFITTRGFRDLLLIGRYHRESLYDPYQKRPVPFVRRRHIFEVSEKIDSSGRVIRPLDVKQAEFIAHRVAALGAKSVAVGFMNSYANNVNEEHMKDILKSTHSEIFVSVSSTIPTIRPLGRFTTAILRACLHPVVQDYLDRLADSLRQRGFAGRLMIVTNNGGMIDGKVALQRPELMLVSGPASGVNAALTMTEPLNKTNLITMDMGGTSCDVSIIESGQPLVTTEHEIEWDYPVNLPMLDIRTIGAGGGSIAWIDKGGSIRVGPRSAGNLPGPACYGKGGTEPTVTDANLILGRLSSKRLLGKEIYLDPKAARMAVKKIADRVGLDIVRTASGIITIVNENMASSLKQVSLNRGRDPRDFCLVAVGGAGPMHAVFLAEILGVKRVIFPSDAGVFCAYGAVVMDLKYDYEKTFYYPIGDVDIGLLSTEYRELDQRGLCIMREQGFDHAQIHLSRSAQMRYIGQTYEVETPVPNGEMGPEELEEIIQNFHSEHEKEYGFSEKTFPAAFVNLRSTSIAKVEKPRLGLNSANAGTGSIDGAIIEEREVYFDDYGFVLTKVYDRKLLSPGFQMRGPAIVDEESSTAVIAPEMAGEVDKYGNIAISITSEHRRRVAT